MIIGIDFDNTIADYTGVFYRVGCALGWLPESVGQSKNEVKQYFIDQDNEARWTELQGIVYGKEITQARPYPGCLETLKKWRKQGHILRLISHKTRYPIIGEKVDFHLAAKSWLHQNGFVGTPGAPFNEGSLFFNETLEKKVLTIAQLDCQAFVDDLEKVLAHKNFPSECKAILFHPHNSVQRESTASSWLEVPDLLC